MPMEQTVLLIVNCPFDLPVQDKYWVSIHIKFYYFYSVNRIVGFFIGQLPLKQQIEKNYEQNILPALQGKWDKKHV